MTKEQKLERFTRREFERNIHSTIVPIPGGGYIAFGRYQLIPHSHGVSVNTFNNEIGLFSNKRSALSWCVADKFNQLTLAQNIKILDAKKQILAADIHCRKTAADRCNDQAFYEIVNTKIQPKLDRFNSVKSELEKCLISAKYLQIRGFNNETARPSGTTTRKTNS